MSKMKAIIQYECKVTLKGLCIFYLVLFAVVSLISLIAAISTGNFNEIGSDNLEINSIICVGIVGVSTFRDDFKMLIQNGFIRKQILVATLAMFMFISGIMALIDTIVGNVLHQVTPYYSSLFGSIYGYDNILANWVWLFLLYTLVCSLFYFGILVINKIGKTLSTYLGILLGGVFLLVMALFKYVLSSEVVNNIVEFVVKAFGFMSDGTINFIFPVLTLLLSVGFLALVSYSIIRRTELR